MTSEVCQDTATETKVTLFSAEELQGRKRQTVQTRQG